MDLNNQRGSDNVEDQRGSGGGFGPGGNGGFGGLGGGGGGMGGAGGLGMLLPLLFRAVGMKGIIILAVLYFGLKFGMGIDLINMVNGGGGGISLPGGTTIQLPGNGQLGQSTSAGSLNGGSGAGTNVAGDAGKVFVSKVLGSTEDVWTKIFSDMGKQYEKPRLVLFNGYTQSGCGTAQSAMGPFYCPADHKVYIDLAFYQDMKDKLGAPGDFAQAYVVAHEVGHHVQNLLGIADQVQAARSRSSETESNALSVRMELQADCLAGIWASEANAQKRILQQGDIEEGLNAANQIGDDRLQKASRGYAVPDSFTHGSSAQRVKWFKAGLSAKSLNDCDTFNASTL
ncbi:MAG: neutral zinc metallopeptidase [Alphaproteobacteria bacterium]|nr:neutral zinc metallopeptidase [Alphaproteobacteria bacterium]